MSMEDALLVWINRSGGDHTPDTENQAASDNHPWVHGHQPIAPSASVQGVGCHTDCAYTKTCVHECFVEVGSLERWHAAILAGFAVEYGVCDDYGATHDGRAIEKALTECTIW